MNSSMRTCMATTLSLLRRLEPVKGLKGLEKQETVSGLQEDPSQCTRRTPRKTHRAYLLKKKKRLAELWFPQEVQLMNDTSMKHIIEYKHGLYVFWFQWVILFLHRLYNSRSHQFSPNTSKTTKN